MKKTLLSIIAVAIFAGVAFGVYRYTSSKGDGPAYRFGKVERGRITAAVADLEATKATVLTQLPA